MIDWIQTEMNIDSLLIQEHHVTNTPSFLVDSYT